MYTEKQPDVPNHPLARLINKKVCNALIGRLWVGGNAFLYDDALEFRANWLNRLIHGRNISWSIPLKEMREVKVNYSFFTHIINIRTGNASFNIRCYGADGFANEINSLYRHDN